MTTRFPARPRRAGALLVLLLVGGLLAAGCRTDGGARSDEQAQEAPEFDPAAVVDLPDRPDGAASSQFWEHWGDGRAELAGYTGEISRYGELREANLVLVYVTEPHDRRTWIKDDDVAETHRVNVLKLNRVLKFQTGIYPYSVMTSTFAPVADWGRRRFQPAKITLTAQEWCGHVFHGIWPGPDDYLTQIRSYFASEGDTRRRVETPEGTLYQDALPIQLRELDGAFNGGEDWSGRLVPSLWQTRKRHAELEPVEATIERRDTELDATPVTRFRLEYADQTVTYDIEKAAPHKLLRWTHSDGSHLRLQKATRLPYWRLNRPGDESYREEIGLEPAIR